MYSYMMDIFLLYYNIIDYDGFAGVFYIFVNFFKIYEIKIFCACSQAG